MQPWEYKVLHRVRPVSSGKVGSWDEPVVSQLPALGEQGWELVTVITRASDPGSMTAGVTTDEMWVFKRPRMSNELESTVVIAQAEQQPDPVLADMEIVTGNEPTRRENW